MALEKVHPAKAPYGYIRNSETGHLEVEPIETQVVKRIFELYKNGSSIRGISNTLNEEKSYLRQGKWNSDKVYKILTNSIYIGLFAYGKTKRKAQDVLYVDNYCEPIIDKNTWDITRKRLEKNKHPNYGEHIHLFTGIVKCPTCGKIMSSTNSFKNSGKPNQKVYYHVTCNNPNCKSKGFHYNSNKIEEKLTRVLNELTRYMYDMDNEIIVCNSTKTKDIKDIEKAIEKLKMQEKKLVDLYLSSTLNVETINNKNDIIKKEIENLNKKKQQIDPNNDFKEYTIELLKKLDCDIEDNEVVFQNRLGFAFVFDSLNRKSKKELIRRLIDTIEIKRDKNYNIEITNIKFTEEFISKSSKDYIEYLYEILQNNNMGFIYKEAITKQELEKLQEDYFVFSNNKIANNEYDNATLTIYNELLKQNFYADGIINCPYIENENIVDYLTLIPRILSEIA